MTDTQPRYEFAAEQLAAAIHRTLMASSIGRKPAKHIEGGRAALMLVATDIAATCGFDRSAFLRECGF